MPQLTTRFITSVRELREYSEKWDDLWHRTAITPPTMQAEQFAIFMDKFEPHSRLWCPVVEDSEGRPVAALPLIEKRKKWFTCGGAPSNEWSGSGDLFLDESADSSIICDTLANSLAHAPWPLLWLDWIPYSFPRWQALFAAFERRGVTLELSPNFDSGQIDTRGDWETYQASWSRNHRRNMGRYTKRLEEEGELTVDIETNLKPHEVEQPLREVFEVENSNWKGEAGTSVLQTPGIWEFYLQQAQQLAQKGNLNLHVLRLAGKPIASEYGFTAKRTYHPLKIGYDGNYFKESPGNLLHMRVLNWCFNNDSIDMLDFLGPLTQSTSSWKPVPYTVGRVMLAPRSLYGRAILGAYRHVWPAVKRLSGRDVPAVAEAQA